MSVIILPSRSKKQPQYAAPIDYAGLAKGVRILWNPAAGPVDLVTGRIWVSGGNAAIATTQRGRAFSFDGADDYYSHTGYPEITGNIGTFFMWCPAVGAADTYGHVLFANSTPSLNWYQVHSSNTLYLMGKEGAGTVSWFNTTNRSIVFS